jgi:hypothetical protein
MGKACVVALALAVGLSQAAADMFNLPPPSSPVPNPPVVGTIVLLDNLDRLHLDVDCVMSIHTLNPDRLTSVADMKASLGGQ